VPHLGKQGSVLNLACAKVAGSVLAFAKAMGTRIVRGRDGESHDVCDRLVQQGRAADAS